MKVLMIEHFSAGNEYSIELCENLSKHVDLTLLTVDNSKIEWDTPDVCKKVLCGYGHTLLKRVGIYFKGFMKTLHEAAFGKYDVIHVQTFRIAYIEILMYVLLKLFGIKLVHTVHNVIPHEAGILDGFFYRIMYGISNALIVHNKSTAEVLKGRFESTAKKINVIPHGTYDFYKRMDIKNEGSTSEVVQFIQIGKIRKYKGAEILVRAAGIVANKYKGRFRVIIAGKQEYEFDFEGLIKREGAQGSVEFINGFLPSEDVANMLGASHACIFPYTNVYGSGALLLSYTFGLPVIVSDIPTFVEETEGGMTGLIFKNEDHEDLARKMIEFIDMDSGKKAAYKGVIERLVESKYSWQNSAELTSRLYRAI